MPNSNRRKANRVTLALLLGMAVAGLAACESAEDRLAKHLANAEQLVTAGETEKATIEYRNALALDANNLTAHLGMAALYEQARNYPAMLAHLNKVVELDPKNVSALVRVGQMMMLGGRLDDAMSNADAALAVDPGDVNALVLKAGVALRLGETAQALEIARRAIDKEPDNATAHAVLIGERLQAKDLSGALAIADDITTRSPKDLGVALVKLQVLEQRGDEAATLAWLEEMISRFPDQLALRSAAAQLHVRNGDLDAAERELRTIADARPDDAQAALGVAQFLLRTKGVDAARAELDAQIKKRTDATPFILALAQLDFDNNNREEATAALTKAVAAAAEAKKTDEANSIRLVLARFALLEQKRDEAKRLAGEVLATDASNAGALGIRAALRFDECDFNGALLDVRAALASQPNNPQLLVLSARTHERNGNTDLAGENYAAAAQASGYETAIVLEFVQHLRRRGRADAALTVLTEAANRRPTDKAILSELAGAQINAGDWVGADATTQKLATLDPSLASRVEAASLTGQARYEESLAVLGRLAADPNQADNALASMIQVYARAGKLDEAVAFLDNLIEENTGNTRALMLRAQVLRSLGKVDAAERDFRTVTQVSPSTGGAYLGLAQLAISRGDREAALKEARAGVEAADNPGALQFFIGSLYERSMDFDGAIEEYRRLYAAQPSSLVAANNLASLLAEHKADDPASIEEAAKVAASLRGIDVPAFQDTVGWVDHLRGDNEQALRNLIPAAEKLAENPYVRFHIGVVYAALGDTESARTHLQAAASADPASFSRVDEAKAALAALPAAQQ